MSANQRGGGFWLEKEFLEASAAVSILCVLCVRFSSADFVRDPGRFSTS